MTSRQGTSTARAFNRIYREAKARKTLLLVFSCFVVFVTTYALILPAITLDQEEAERQGGIDVTAEQQAEVTAEDNEVSADSEAPADSEVPEQSVSSEDTAPAGTITFEGKGYTVQADCADLDLPGDTEIVAEEIGKKDKDYDSLYEDALEVLRQDGKSSITGFDFAIFYDISLMSDGEPIEPDTPVDVTISYDKALKASDADNLRIVHFAVNSETGEVTPEVLADDQVSAEIKSDKMSAATFETASFSVFAVVYTVDFEYDVDGQKYTYSIEGGSSISLADLLQQLHVIKDDPDTEPNEAELFMEDIETVEFSSPDLVNVEQNEEGKWTLTSLQPFTSEETLTVSMKNGDQFVVKVTDAQKAYKDVSALENGTYIIYRSDNSSTRFMFMKNDGTTKIIRPENGQSLNESDLSDYTWTVTKNWDGSFSIKSTNGNRYINLYGNNNEYDKWSSNGWASVTLSGSNGIAISQDRKVVKRDDTGFYNATGTGVGLTFYKIEENSSGGSSSTPGIVLSDAERQWLENWKNTLENFNTLTDYGKSAEVYDEDQRIYQIDINASSGVTDFYKDVDLGFVLDISNSMQFPSSLKALEHQNGDEYKVWMTADQLNEAKATYSEYYNNQNCFYIISDPALTSTIYRVFWDGSAWRYQDASELGNDNIYYVNDGTVFKEPYRQAYTLYYADDTTKRFKYLQDSVSYAINTLKKIVTPTEVVDDETASVRVAYNLFASQIYESDSFKDLRDNANRLFEIPLEYTKPGTRQDLALYDGNFNPSYPWTLDTSDELSANEFGWDTGSNQYVILVTDGAPNGAAMNDVRAAANNLKSQYPNVKIFTIGLSTKDVDGGSQMLYDIADEVGGQKQFYEAEKAQDLEYILLKILRTIMAEGLVRGTVTDTIDKGFYPVDAQGNPLSAGVYRANGTRIQNAQISNYVSNGKPTAAHQNEVFYTWEQVGDEWKITWYNQEIGWDDNNASTGNPWTGTVYVKAKEDYLGGNLIETNDGNAQIEPTGIKLVINGTPESSWRPLENMTPIDLPVPRVNVHNLETKENSTTWTVYKGTSVTPKDQIKALWDAIPIEEVVSASEEGQHKRTTGASANVGTAGAGETFTLGSLMLEVAPTFNIDNLINQITATKNSASQEFTYSAYGHESGKITVKVERTVGNQTPAAHTADTVGSPVEQYKVTFTYKPYTETERMNGKVKDPTDADNHNGPAGRGEEETGTITSTNTHTINVFQKGIKVTKVDKTNINQPLEGAVFELYRADEDGNADVSSYDLPTGSYTKVGDDLTANSQGVIEINPVIPDKDTTVSDKTFYLPNINVGATANTSHDTVFYLVEKTAPTVGGTTYSKMPGAIKFTMTLSENKGTNATATLYDWTQTAAIVAAEYENGSTTYLAVDSANTTTGTNADIYAYKIKNGKPTDITLIKVDKGSGESIGGAKFNLLRGSENVDLAKLTITAINGGTTVTPEDYDLNGTTIKVVTVPEGGIRIAGLADDTYTLQEVAAPAGYIITDSGKTFKTENGTVKNSDDSAHQNEAADITFKVENESGAALPNAGGPGTTWIYLIGSLLLIGCGIALVTRRRMRI